jgi:hypothetical protein
MANGEHLNDMLTVREVVRLFPIHPNTLRHWGNSGRIRAYRITPRARKGSTLFFLWLARPAGKQEE